MFVYWAARYEEDQFGGDNYQLYRPRSEKQRQIDSAIDITGIFIIFAFLMITH